MTWLAALLKPLLAPVILFGLYYPARCGAVAVSKWMRDGRLKRLLLRKL